MRLTLGLILYTAMCTDIRTLGILINILTNLSPFLQNLLASLEATIFKGVKELFELDATVLFWKNGDSTMSYGSVGSLFSRRLDESTRPRRVKLPLLDKPTLRRGHV